MATTCMTNHASASAYIVCRCGKPVHRKRATIAFGVLGCDYCRMMECRAASGESVILRRWDAAKGRRA